MTSTLDVNAPIDTNILTAIRDKEHTRHVDIRETVVRLHASHRLIVAPQSLYEYWSVATRPKNVNGMGRSPEQAALDIEVLRRSFTVLPDPTELLDEWLDLCRTYGVSGKTAHDARLAAYARLHTIPTLITLNARDFARYGLNVAVP